MDIEEDIKLELDEDLIKDFLEEFHDCNEEVERTLLLLDQDSTSKDLINQLFRSVHTIKSNLRMVALDRLSEIVHTLENIIDDVRNNRHQYVEGTSDIILVVITQVHELSVQLLHDANAEDNMDYLYNAVHHLCMVEPEHLQHEIYLTLQKLDPDGDYRDDDELVDDTASEPVRETQPSPEKSLEEITFEIDSDMEFFIELGQQMEDSFSHWQGRNKRMLDLCLQMNQMAGTPIDTSQLAAAVYLHDIGMSFIPSEILSKPAKLDADEELILQNHCHLGHEWLKRIKGWESAAKIVYQHHERVNGSGYPQGLKNDEICDGAKIIAIANTYEAMTNSRAHRQHKRPIVRAVLEINGNSGTLYDTQWVEHFNQVIKMRTKKT